MRAAVPGVRNLCAAGFAAMVVLASLCPILAGQAKAETVPQELASMAKDLFTQGRAELRETTGDPQQDAALERARGIFKEAGVRFWARIDVRASDAQDGPHTHVMSLGENNDKLELNWDPANNNFEIRITANETSEGAGDNFDLLMIGGVSSTPTDEGNDSILTVRPGATSVNLVTGDELRQLAHRIYGKWRDDRGYVWEISASNGEGPTGDPAQRTEEQIDELEWQIEQISSDKVFRWKNLDSGEIVEQDKFRRLNEPFEFLGEDLRRADGKEEIARLQERLEELRAADNPPVKVHDPVQMEEMRGSGDTQALRIRVTDNDGYSWTYDHAMFSGNRITASRTLRNMEDITNLPEDVTRQLIESWSPPEWIELDAGIEVESRKVYLSGLRWRLKVTYSGDDHRVKRIHTPYSVARVLKGASEQIASGAAEAARP